MITRRELLRLLPPFLMAASTGGCRLDGGPIEAMGDDTDAGSGTATGDAACSATADDIEGPFYRADAPVRDDLARAGDEGTALLLSGHVLTVARCEPVPGAVIDLWQAAPDGTYDNGSEQMHYRGRVVADAEGRWSLRTLETGRYLNGSRYRPAHLHVKVWVGAEERLTTQLYFPGDPYNASDPWYSAAMEMERTGAGAARFDFHV